MKKNPHHLFLFYLLCWCAVHFFRWLQAPIPVINDHLTDFLFIPAASHLALQIMRRYLLHDAAYRLPLSFVLFFAAYASIVLEWLAPFYSGRHTADRVDVLAYFLGSLFYYYVHQGRAQKRGATGTPQFYRK